METQDSRSLKFTRSSTLSRMRKRRGPYALKIEACSSYSRTARLTKRPSEPRGSSADTERLPRRQIFCGECSHLPGPGTPHRAGLNRRPGGHRRRGGFRPLIGPRPRRTGSSGSLDRSPRSHRPEMIRDMSLCESTLLPDEASSGRHASSWPRF